MSNLQDIRIIFSDIDGTLLPFSGKDLSRTAGLLKDLMEAGYVFVPCTGRGTENLPPEIRSLPGLRYVITANGALITDLLTGETPYRRLLSRELALKITNALRPLCGHVYLYRHGIHHMDLTDGLHLGAALSGTFANWVATAVKTDFLRLLKQDGWDEIDKMGFASYDRAIHQAVRDTLNAQPWHDEILVSSSGDWNVEINAPGASKGLAALWLIKQLGFTPKQTLSAGDNYNDLTMLEMAGISVAPANAVQKVREAAAVVVPDCKEDGVENYLQQLLQIKE